MLGVLDELLQYLVVIARELKYWDCLASIGNAILREVDFNWGIKDFFVLSQLRGVFSVGCFETICSHELCFRD